jgi:membrane protease YdiL (CAAX protease family)
MEAPAHNPTAGVDDTGRRFSWRTLAVILAVAGPTSLLLIPYSMTLLGQGDGTEIPPLWILVVGQLSQGVVFAAIAAALGLWLGPKVGLGAPDLRGMLRGEPGSGRRVQSALPLAAGVGVAIGVVSLALQAGFRPLFPEAARQSIEGVSIPSPWEGFLASISAGFNEEVWFRLGLMTLLVFLGAKLSRQGGRPAPGVIWTAIALVALLFAAVHLPQIAALAGGLPAPLVAFVLLTTGSGGVAFGWLYWKRGLVAAMVAHFSADVVVKVVFVAAMAMSS